MKVKIMHEIKGRIRFHVIQNRMSYEQADILQYYFYGKEYYSCKCSKQNR